MSAQSVTKHRIPRVMASGRTSHAGIGARRGPSFPWRRESSLSRNAWVPAGTTDTARTRSADGWATTRREDSSPCSLERWGAFIAASGDLHLEVARVLHRVLAVPRDPVHQLRGAHQLLRYLHARSRGGLLVDLDLVHLLRHRE